MLVHELPHLDMIINNACQTIRRPRSYYQHLLPTEANALTDLNPDVANLVGTAPMPPAATLTHSLLDDQRAASTPTASATAASSNSTRGVPHGTSAEASQQVVTAEDAAEMDPALFPKNVFDVNKQQLDLRQRNSWLLKLGEIDTGEVAEVFAINSIAPFVLNSKLKPLLLRRGAGGGGGAAGPGAPLEPKFIINVSAMEGKFYRFKSANHPHTNMAKAALNMMTRTSASDYAEDHIFMNAVDTGWINDENPLDKARGIAGVPRVHVCFFLFIVCVARATEMLILSLIHI